MTLLNPSSVAKKYLLIPNPKAAVIFRLSAEDQLASAKKISHGFFRSPRSRRSKETLAFDREIHLWSDTLAGWTPEVNDYVALATMNEIWMIVSVSNELMGNVFVCAGKKSRVTSEISSAIVTYIQSTSTGIKNW